MYSVGERIAYARRALGATQEEIAKAIDIKRASLAQLETGVSKRPNASNLIKLARVLRVLPEWLALGETTPSLRTLGRRLREAREKAGLSPAQLARRAGLREERIHLLETGAAIPSPDEEKALADALGLAALPWPDERDTWTITRMNPTPHTRASDLTEEADHKDTAADPLEDLSPDERALLAKYRRMDAEQKKALQTLVSSLAEPGKKQKTG